MGVQLLPVPLHILGLLRQLVGIETRLVLHGAQRVRPVVLELLGELASVLVLGQTRQRVEAGGSAELLDMVDQFAGVVELHAALLALVGAVFECVARNRHYY